MTFFINDPIDRQTSLKIYMWKFKNEPLPFKVHVVEHFEVDFSEDENLQVIFARS